MSKYINPWVCIRDREPTERDANKDDRVLVTDREDFSNQFWEQWFVVRKTTSILYWIPLCDPRKREFIM